MLTSPKIKTGQTDKFAIEEEEIGVRRNEGGSYGGKEQRLFDS